MSWAPLVSIGLPVFNGERYLAEALESLLEQDFADFEIVISDNASTDRTRAICRAAAARDGRLRYIRNSVNRGAALNYQQVFWQARGRYFKWAAHDDLCDPRFLSTCVTALEADRRAVLAFPRTAAIDAGGDLIRTHRRVTGFDDPRPERRFARALAIGDEIFLIWGLMRREALARTRLLGSFVGHDRPLLSSLSLLGPFAEVRQTLLFQREHSARSVNQYDWRRPRSAITWYDPAVDRRRIMPAWRLLREHAGGIARARLGVADSMRCARELARWAMAHRRELGGDVANRARAAPAVSRLARRLDPIAGPVNRVVPEASAFILVDDDTIETELFGSRSAIPFLERDGMYWGPPENDEVAIRELERLRARGACFMVFTANTFWWPDHYRGLFDHIRARYTPVHDSERYRIYDLGRR